ncbi:hypothetical protein LQF12_02560 [Ruania suaedae]|uniref:hypothetical protein n=1 Tax=Ruania suaedae TaxID=2897774 RepID=UPI001E364E8B|nr:hypothetical protein [Ruania suaedae]UFU03511.1 hypothetical protein LQF12_02560 [Ruania suaedae]
MSTGDLVAALAPSIGVTVLFVIVIRAMVQADRRERRAQARAERERGTDQTRDSRS